MPTNFRKGTIKKKVLLLLKAGWDLHFTRSLGKYCKQLEALPKEWEEINRRALERAIESLYQSKLIKEKCNQDGTITMILTEDGKNVVLQFDLEKIKVQKMENWDGKWRIVMFDVPEKLKKVREALRFHFKDIGLIEFQKSIFIHPFPCQKEIEFIIEFYNARKYVRFVLAEEVDNELHLKHKFKLN
ncbi:MAG: hypothetical protein AAB693_00615 [Patescibacteria group bacterium]